MTDKLCQKIMARWPSISKFNLGIVINNNLLCNNTICGGDCYGNSYCDLDKNKCKHENIKCKYCGFIVCGCCYHNILLDEYKCPLCEKNPKGERLYDCFHYEDEAKHWICATCGMKICHLCHTKCSICKYYDFGDN